VHLLFQRHTFDLPLHIREVIRSAKQVIHVGVPYMAIVLAHLCLSVAAQAHDVGTAAYFLPLVDDYEIHKSDPSDISSDGMFQLVRVKRLASGSVSAEHLLSHVKRVAVRDRVIFGETDDAAFFVFDANASDPKPETFTASDAWLAALHAKQIDSADRLQAPDTLAANVADETLRPWDYRYLHNLAGVPDAGWSLILQILGLVLSFILGVLNRPRNRAVSIAAGLGILVNIVGQMILAGEGPALCPGFVVFPLVFMLAAWLGGRARKIPRVFAGTSSTT
jgi:hypothetical protein